MNAPLDSKFPPDALPEKLIGCTRKLLARMKFKNGTSGFFAIYDPQGRALPVGWQYDTRPLGVSGFTTPRSEGVLTWPELVKHWPEFIAAQAV